MISNVLLQQLWQQYATIRDTPPAPPLDIIGCEEDASNIAVPLIAHCSIEDASNIAVPLIAHCSIENASNIAVPLIAPCSIEDASNIAVALIVPCSIEDASDIAVAACKEDASREIQPCADSDIQNTLSPLQVLPKHADAGTTGHADAGTSGPVRMPLSVSSKKQKYITHTDLEAHDKTGCLFMTCERQAVGYRFGCNSFASRAALATTSVLLTKGLLSGDQISIRSSLRIKQNLNGATGYSAVIRGPIYHLQAGVSFADGKKMVLLHAAKVLFRVYVKLVSKLRVLFFETSLENYVGQAYDDCNEKTQDVILRQVAMIPALSSQANIISPANILQHATRVMEKMTKSLTEGSKRDSLTNKDAENATNFTEDDNVDASPQTSLVGSEEASLVGSEDASLVGSEEASMVGSEEASMVGSEEASLVGSEEASLVGSEEEASTDDTSFIVSEDDGECEAAEKKQGRANKRKRTIDECNENNVCFFCSKSKANVVFPCGLHAACHKCRHGKLVLDQSGSDVPCPYCRM